MIVIGTELIGTCTKENGKGTVLAVSGELAERNGDIANCIGEHDDCNGDGADWNLQEGNDKGTVFNVSE